MNSTLASLFDGIDQPIAEESVWVLLEQAGLRIERIVSYGHASPPGFWYDQEQNEWVLLLKGAARLRVEERVVDLQPGNCLNLPAHARHRVEWTAPGEPTLWLCVYY